MAPLLHSLRSRSEKKMGENGGGEIDDSGGGEAVLERAYLELHHAVWGREGSWMGPLIGVHHDLTIFEVGERLPCGIMERVALRYCTRDRWRRFFKMASTSYSGSPSMMRGGGRV